LKKKSSALFLAVLWFIVTVILLTLPGNAFPKEDWLTKIWFDKWVHIGLFSLIVFLFCNWARQAFDTQQVAGIFWKITILAIVYGIAMEFVQKYWIPNRSFDLGDIAADAVGAFLGLAWCRWRYLKK
jgi:VanZ family protein